MSTMGVCTCVHVLEVSITSRIRTCVTPYRFSRNRLNESVLALNKHRVKVHNRQSKKAAEKDK